MYIRREQSTSIEISPFEGDKMGEFLLNLRDTYLSRTQRVTRTSRWPQSSWESEEDAKSL